MADDQKLTDLPERTSPNVADEQYIFADDTDQKTTLQRIFDYLKSLTQTLTNKTIDGDDNTVQDLPYSSIKSTSRTGSDVKLVTGTKGIADDLAVWNSDGDLVDGPTPPSGTIVGTSDTQELTNKTHDGDFNLKNVTDNVTVADDDPDMILELPAGSWSPTTTSPCSDITTVEAGTNDIDYKVLDFATGADENAFLNFQMPTNYDGGVIQFRYVWTNASGITTEVVVFELSGRAYADDGAIDQAVGTAVEVADTWIAQGDIHISAWSGDVTLAGTPAGGQWVHLEIMRDVAGGGTEDDLTGDARLIGVQIKYKIKQYSN